MTKRIAYEGFFDAAFLSLWCVSVLRMSEGRSTSLGNVLKILFRFAELWVKSRCFGTGDELMDKEPP